MTLDRGTLAKIDRRVFAEFDQSGGMQLVKVPVSEAVWSTWKRYCSVVGVTMGQGIAGLVVHELETVVDRDGDHGSVLGVEMERRLATRAEDLDARELRLNERERLLRASMERLRTAERLLQVAQSPPASTAKIGRNERCPCGSGLKYKHCHGPTGHRT
ncbi:MAG: SEC-C metal-binding domain-containing protein [Acidimicrobiia bacterium]|nr:SEC-C metal-binding domain-containing protein [Acidimicrobiia bacterium]